jgi:N-acylneuraminate cytidylyltransferase
MIHDRSVLGVILARGGSKGLPGKNIRSLADKPLIAWTIEAGLASRYIDRLVLSSDDTEIMRAAVAYGCEVPFKRPAELARDSTPSIDAVVHAMNKMPPHDYVVLLQPTSPLRSADDIDNAIRLCDQHGAPACVSVTKSEKPPQWMYTVTDDGHMTPVLENAEDVTRRQDAPDTYVLNGAVYVARTDWLREMRSFTTSQTMAYLMPPRRSVDVDSELDLALCSLLLENRTLYRADSIAT